MNENVIDLPEQKKVSPVNLTESVLLSFAVVGGMFKILHWPGANIIITLTLCSLAIIYFPLGFYFLGNAAVRTTAIITGMFLSCIPLGILFKIMHWPGASIMLVIAAASAPVMVLFLIFMRKKATALTLEWYNSMLMRTALLNVMLFIMMLVKLY